MNFQEVILSLQRFRADKGCVIQQPYDIEVDAGTFNPGLCRIAAAFEIARRIVNQVIEESRSMDLSNRGKNEHME